MADNTEERTVTAEEQQPPTMADAEEQPPQHETKKPEKISTASFSIWPPTQRTRDAVINRLVETLTAPSILSKRYGTMPNDVADEVSRRIEDKAFAAASSASLEDDGEDHGIEILQVYSKEIGKNILAAVKSRSASGSALNGDNASQTLSVLPTASEEVSAVETEA